MYLLGMSFSREKRENEEFYDEKNEKLTGLKKSFLWRNIEKKL